MGDECGDMWDPLDPLISKQVPVLRPVLLPHFASQPMTARYKRFAIERNTFLDV